jgi:PAS domain S-box-containing protein
MEMPTSPPDVPEASRFDSLAESVAVYELDGTIVSVNLTTEALFGRPRRELLGARIWELFPEAVGNAFHQAFGRVSAGGPSEIFDHRYDPWDRWFRNQIYLWNKRVHVFATEITAHKKAEARLEALARASETLAGPTEPRRTFEEIARLFAECLGDCCDIRLVNEAGTHLESVALRYREPVDLEAFREVSVAPLLMGQGLTSQVFVSGEPLLVPVLDTAAHAASLQQESFRKAAERFGAHSVMMAPLRDGERTIGVLVMCRNVTRQPYAAEDLALLEELSHRGGMAITRARLQEQAALALQAEREARRLAEQAAERTSRLQRLTAAFASVVTADEAARALAREGSGVLGAGATFVWLLEPQGEQLELVASDGTSGAAVDPYLRISLRAPLPAGDAVRRREIIFLESRAARLRAYPAMGDGAGGGFHAWAAVPMVAGDRAYGAFVLSFREPRAFTDSDGEFLRTIAEQCTQTIERTRLFEAERAARETAERNAQQTHRLQLITSLLSRSRQRAEVAEIVLREGLDLIGGATGALWVLDGEGETLHMLASFGYADDRPFRVQPINGDAPVAHAVRTGEALYLGSADAYQRAFPASASRVESIAPLDFGCACLPLRAEGRVVGGMAFAFASAHQFAPEERAFLEVLANQCAQALDRARLLEEERAATAALAERNRTLGTIITVTSEMSRARTPEEVASTTARHGTEALHGEACVIWIAQPDGALRLLAGHGVPELHFGAWQTLPRDSGMPAFQVLQTGEPLWIETDEEYQRLAPEIYAHQRAANRVRAFATLPLTIAGRRNGVVVFSFPIGHRFSDDEKGVMLTLARQCEQALDRAQLFAQEAEARGQAEEAQSRAEAASRAKDEFLAMLGHELRNPLAPIVTALQLMKLRGDQRSSKEQQVIERQISHLLRLVDDLLDVSRITRGKVNLRKEPIELAEAVAKAVEIASPLLEQKQHRFTVSVPAQGMCLEADPIRLAQVIANLLTNAAKYTEPGGHIRVSAVRQGPDLVISVKDDGSGIEPDDLSQIFDLFVQGPRSADRGQGGLGIGLTLVRNLVRMHGGEVTASSEGAGKGSEFVVRLPALDPGDTRPPAPIPGPLDRTPSAAPRRVLLVDDNVDAVEVLGELVRSAGHEVILVHDGPQALRVVESFRPDVAILDIGLPVMDGYELAARLRERLPLRLAALTGYGQDHDRARSAAAGFQAHFVKPVMPEVLLAYIDAD